MTVESKEIVQKISQIICDKKGFNIVALEISHYSTVGDFILIAEGNVQRHTMAIAQEIVTTMRDQHKLRPTLVEGWHTGDWILLDYSGILVHLFIPEMREKFQLEKLWSEGKNIELNISLSA